MYFLNDYVEFSRAYDRWLQKQTDPKYNSRKKMVKILRNNLKDNYIESDVNILRKLTGGLSVDVEKERMFKDSILDKYSNNLTEKQLLNETRKNNILKMEKKIHNQRFKPYKPTKQPNKPKKFINKYTLGAAGLLGAGAATYGGYKLLKRNKNKGVK